MGRECPLPGNGKGFDRSGHLRHREQAGETRLHALLGGVEHRWTDHQRPGALLWIVRDEPPGPRGNGVVPHPHSRHGQLRALSGQLHVPIPLKPVLRQAVIRAECETVARSQFQCASRNGYTRLRWRDKLASGEQRQERCKHGDTQASLGARRPMAERSHSHLAVVPLEPGSHEPTGRGAQLRRHRTTRWEGYRAGLQARPRVVPRRRYILRPPLEGATRSQGRCEPRLPALSREQTLQQQSGVCLQRRHRTRALLGPLSGAVSGELRLRQSGPERTQHRARRVRPRRLEPNAPFDPQPRRPLGLRVQHARQQLRNAAGYRRLFAAADLQGLCIVPDLIELLHRRHAAPRVPWCVPAAARAFVRPG